MENQNLVKEKLTLSFNPQPNERFKIRWRYDYADGSKKFGLWSMPGKHDNEKPSRTYNLSVVYAAIEAKSNIDYKIYQLAECDGNNFVAFQYIAMASIAPFGIKGEVTPPTYFGGMKLLTKTNVYQVVPSGHISVKPITSGELDLDFRIGVNNGFRF